MAKKKAAAEVSVARPNKKIQLTPGNDLPTYYVNSVNVDISTFDVRLRLGQIQAADDESVQIKEVAYVYMSQSHFMVLANVINGMAQKLTATPSPLVQIGEAKKAH
jgi:hypothetical protein